MLGDAHDPRVPIDEVKKTSYPSVRDHAFIYGQCRKELRFCTQNSEAQYSQPIIKIAIVLILQNFLHLKVPAQLLIG